VRPQPSIRWRGPAERRELPHFEQIITFDQIDGLGATPERSNYRRDSRRIANEKNYSLDQLFSLVASKLMIYFKPLFDQSSAHEGDRDQYQ
jgi:hypothetical protein